MATMSRVSKIVRCGWLAISLTLWMSGLFHPVFAQQDTLYWYASGSKQLWYPQSDVFAFLVDDSRPVSITSGFPVDSMYFDAQQGLQILFFNPNTSMTDRDNIIQQVIQDNAYIASLKAITQNPGLTYKDNKWQIAGIRLHVLFRNGIISTSDLLQFLDRYHIHLFHAPANSLPSGGRYIYIFEIDHDYLDSVNSIALAALMIENDSNMVSEAKPELLQVFSPGSSNIVYPTGLNDTNSPDFEIIYQFNQCLYFRQTEPVMMGLNIDIYDLNGKSINSYQLPPGKTAGKVDVSNLPTGHYFLHIADAQSQLLKTYRFYVHQH